MLCRSSSTDFWRILEAHDLKKSFSHKIRFVFCRISGTIQPDSHCGFIPLF